MYNFSAGPAVLPVPVLEQAQRELLNWAGSGMSVMEMSHRCGRLYSMCSNHGPCMPPLGVHAGAQLLASAVRQTPHAST